MHALAAQAAAVLSTVVDRGFSTATQHARYMNSTGVMNGDGVSPSNQQALAKVLNVDGDSLLASVAASVVPVVVASVVAQADAAQADASQADVSQAAIVAAAADKGSPADLQVNVEASASEAGFNSGKAGADTKATASEVVEVKAAKVGASAEVAAEVNPVAAAAEVNSVAAVAAGGDAQAATYAQATADAFGDGHVIGKVTFGQPSACILHGRLV